MTRVVSAVMDFLGLYQARPVDEDEPKNGCIQRRHCSRRGPGSVRPKPQPS